MNDDEEKKHKGGIELSNTIVSKLIISSLTPTTKKKKTVCVHV